MENLTTSQSGLAALAPTQSVTTRNFMRFWYGQTLSQFGTRIGAVGMPVVAVAVLHADNRQVGILGAAATIAFLLFGLPAGALVDRWLKRPIMMISDAVRGFAILAVPVLWSIGALEIWHLYVVAAVIGLATVFFDVAYQSYIPHLVPDDDIGRANARLESTAQLATTGGPALGGLLMRVVSAPVVLLSDTLAYAISFGSLALTRDAEPRRPPVQGLRRSLMADIGEGLRFVRDQPVIRRLVLSMGFSNLFANMVATLLPVLVLRQLGLDGFILGVVMTFASIGGAIGAVIAPWLRRRCRDAAVMAGALVAASLFCMISPIAGLVGPGRSTLAAVLVVVSEFGLMACALVFNVTQVSVRQRLCPKNLLGRMNASIRFVVWGSTPISALLAGWLASDIGLVPTMWIGGVGALLTVLPIVRIGRFIPAAMAA